MAVDVTLKTVASGYNTNTINQNFEAIASALEDAVSRSGATPNSMSADLDLNGHKILNIGGLDFGNEVSAPTVKTNAITELTPNSGVSVEGVLVKDGLVDGRDVSDDGDKLDDIESRSLLVPPGQTGGTVYMPSGAGHILATDGNGNLIDGGSIEGIENAIAAAEEAVEAAEEAVDAAASVSIRRVESLAALKAINSTLTKKVYLDLGFKSGWFSVLAGNYSAQVAADTTSAIFLALDDAPAIEKALVRDDHRQADFDWFGANPSAAENNDELAAAEAMGVAGYIDAIVVERGGYNITLDTRPTTPLVYLGGWITRNGNESIFYPRSAIDLTSGRNKRNANMLMKRVLNPSELVNPATGGYKIYPYTQQVRMEYTNLAGWRDKVTSTTSQVAQNFYSVTHLGHGDCYGAFYSGSVSETGDTSGYIDWGYQKSIGAINGQLNAVTDRVNLYFDGDCVVNDGGHDGVSMFGSVRFVEHDGGNVAEYATARIGYLIKSTGLNFIDACFVAAGKSFVGFDATGGNFSSNIALAVEEGMGIAWAANGSPPNGKFSTQDTGDSRTYMSSSILIDQVAGTGILRRGASYVDVTPGADGFATLRVNGASTTARLQLGQAGTASAITANSTGTDNTSLQFRTANAGVEATQWTISATGNFSPGADNTQNVGSVSNRIKEIFAANAVINTSDQNLKSSIEDVPDEWLDAWGDVRWARYKFKDAYEVKGDAARWHVGLIAQEIDRAFSSRGLNAFEIGLLCRDKETVKRTRLETGVRVKTEEVEAEEVREVLDGDVIRQEVVTVKRRKPVVRRLPLLAPDGSPVLEEAIKRDEDGSPVRVPKRDDQGRTVLEPVYELVPVFREAEETEEFTYEVEFEEQADSYIWGVRYTEALALEAAFVRRELTKLKGLVALS
jgi:hypothetical protein